LEGIIVTSTVHGAAIVAAPINTASQTQGGNSMKYRKGAKKSKGISLVKDLKKGSVIRISGNRVGQSICCLNGMIWVTQQGDDRDRILNGGEMYLSNLRSIIVIVALIDAKIKICSQRKERSIGRFPKSSRVETRLVPETSLAVDRVLIYSAG